MGKGDSRPRKQLVQRSRDENELCVIRARSECLRDAQNSGSWSIVREGGGQVRSEFRRVDRRDHLGFF